jgi:ribosomal protein L16 Arg81 hydroxylase
MLDVLGSSGFERRDAAREIHLARMSPYLRGAELLRNRLRKREWVLSIYRKLNRLRPNSAEVERRHKLPREDFLREYYTTNRPVIITGMMDDWPAVRKWSLDYFAEHFGDREVELQMNRNSSPDYEAQSAKLVRRIPFGEFLEKVRTARESNDFYLTANNSSHNRAALPELWDDIVQIPEYLRSDESGGFFWMGPAGTITPFHHDLTNNFMAQVMGRKRLEIAPSWDIPLMSNHFHCYSRVDGRVTPPAPHPPIDQPQILECVLHPGEILFLPIGCMHYVQGLDITVTVSFTNFVFDNDFYSRYTCYSAV